jgi:hypothetical protein
VTDIRQMITEYFERTGDADENTRRVLNRIANDRRASDAFHAMTDEIAVPWDLMTKYIEGKLQLTTFHKWLAEERELVLWDLMTMCIEAELQLTTFHKLLAEEREVVERLQQHRRSVEDLRQFIDQATKHDDRPLVGWRRTALPEKTPAPTRVDAPLEKGLSGERLLLSPQKGADYYQHAFDSIAKLIDERQQMVGDIMLDLGVTRKSHNKSAAETAAIGRLADGVALVTRKPFAPQVAVLAEVVLGIHDVSEDRVREALKARRRRLVHSTTK